MKNNTITLYLIQNGLYIKHLRSSLELTDAQPTQASLVCSLVLGPEVFEELLSFGENGHETTSGGVISLVFSQMLSELFHPGTHTGNLSLWGSRVILMALEIWYL